MENLMNEAVGIAFVMAPIIGIVIQLIKQSEINNKWLPHVSVVAGTVVGLIFAVAMGADYFIYGLAGFLSGAAASGLYDLVVNTKGDK